MNSQSDTASTGPRHASPHPGIVAAVYVVLKIASVYPVSSFGSKPPYFGVPVPARFSDGLRSVFFKAPVPSGCTFTEVESREKASIRRRTICCICSCSKTRSSTPFFAQRFMRV
jgi:hypothetical protein